MTNDLVAVDEYEESPHVHSIVTLYKLVLVSKELRTACLWVAYQECNDGFDCYLDAILKAMQM